MSLWHHVAQNVKSHRGLKLKRKIIEMLLFYSRVTSGAKSINRLYCD